METNLLHLIYEARKLDSIKSHLTENEVNCLVSLLGERCRGKTLNVLRRRLSLPLSLLPTHGIFERVVLGNDSAQYFAGQSYPDEVREVRRLLIEG